MRKRPHQHYRSIKTRKGRRRVLINKGIRKRKKRQGFVDPGWKKLSRSDFEKYGRGWKKVYKLRMPDVDLPQKGYYLYYPTRKLRRMPAYIGENKKIIERYPALTQEGRIITYTKRFLPRKEGRPRTKIEINKDFFYPLLERKRRLGEKQVTGKELTDYIDKYYEGKEKAFQVGPMEAWHKRQIQAGKGIGKWEPVPIKKEDIIVFRK